MFNGQLKNVEDICVGDLLIEPDSKPRKVLSLVHGIDNMYNVEPIKGEPFVVNSGHILNLKRTPHRSLISRRKAYPSEVAGQIINIQLTEHLNCSKTFKHGINSIVSQLSLRNNK